MIGYENSLIQKEDGTAKVIVNRSEQVNAFKTEMYYEVIDLSEIFASCPEIMVVVITGVGKSFVAGADVSEITGKVPPVVNGQMVNPVALATQVVEESDEVVIAMTNGYTIEAGYELAMACYLLVHAESARFGITSAKIGVCTLERRRRQVFPPLRTPIGSARSLGSEEATASP